jgi:predicted nucleic acid-binding protein
VRLVIDANVLVSALLGSASLPAHLFVLWRTGKFDLLIPAALSDERFGGMRTSQAGISQHRSGYKLHM